MKLWRPAALFAIAASATAWLVVDDDASAQPRKSAPKAPPKKREDPDASALLAGKEGAEPKVATADAGKAAAVLEAKAVDGGARVFRFGEVEVEGRLKSPQIVYFLRRVRAEFAAGDLGHRTFFPELGETKNEPGF